MEYFWAALATVVLGLIIWAIIDSRVRARRPVTLGGAVLPEIEGAFSTGRRYLVVLTSGARFEAVRILGFAQAVSGPQVQAWSSTRWLVLEHEDGRKSLVSPHSIRFLQEAAASSA
jgi:hypothetical protein